MNEKLKQNRCTGKSSYTELFPNGLKSALIDWKTTNKKEIKLENNFSYAWTSTYGHALSRAQVGAGGCVEGSGLVIVSTALFMVD